MIVNSPQSPWIRRILVAVDRSANAAAALLYGVTLANAHDAALTVLHVVDPPIDRMPVRVVAERRREMAAMIDALPTRTPRLELRLVIGDPCKAIVGEARRGRYSLVLVGERGETVEAQTRAPARTLGSTAVSLLRNLEAVLPVRSDLWGVPADVHSATVASSS